MRMVVRAMVSAAESPWGVISLAITKATMAVGAATIRKVAIPFPIVRSPSRVVRSRFLAHRRAGELTLCRQIAEGRPLVPAGKDAFPRFVSFRLASLLAVASLTSAGAASADLKVGDPAPDFTLPGTGGEDITLSAQVGEKNVVLAFFPKAFTGG